MHDRRESQRSAAVHFLYELALPRVVDVVRRNPGDELSRGPCTPAGGDAIQLRIYE